MITLDMKAPAHHGGAGRSFGGLGPAWGWTVRHGGSGPAGPVPGGLGAFGWLGGVGG
jgi:hypothetical protein